MSFFLANFCGRKRRFFGYNRLNEKNIDIFDKALSKAYIIGDGKALSFYADLLTVRRGGVGGVGCFLWAFFSIIQTSSV